MNVAIRDPFDNVAGEVEGNCFIEFFNRCIFREKASHTKIYSVMITLLQ